ncbi:MAG: AAA family ATPase, partial [Deltaproteobacteria bacterium]|nr:AAA family ATPase [Deltaproteobacteria bacterium]
PVPWITRGQCIEHYGAGEAYLPILDALEHLCRAPGGDHLVELLDRYAPTWLVQMPAVLGTADVAALQRRVVGATHERMLREVTGALEALTTDSTVILVLEDLHWSDYSTLDLLSFLARRQSPARLLIIGTYRPADVLRREHPLYPVKQELHLHGQCEEISVRSLTTEDVGEYLARQFAGGTFATTLGAVVHHRTEGNPLFMVTVVKDFVTQGIIARRDGQWDLVGEIGKIEVPSGLRRFIEQQLTRSTPEEHAVLEAASVVGMDFSVAAVAVALGMDSAGVEATCEALARRGQFLRAHGVSTWPDGTVAARYRFLHALYQEVLYERMSAGRRIGIHRQVGARVEAAYGNRTTEIATELAVHFEQGQDMPRAVQYLGHAGENAIRQNAHVEAIRLLTHAIALLHTQPDTPERAQQELGLSLLLRTPLAATKGYVAPELEHAYTRALELCKQVGGPPQLFMVLGGPYALHLLRAELRAASRVAEERMRLAESLQFDLFLQVAHFSLGVPLLFMGDFTQARLHLERSVALYKPQQLSALGHLYDPGVMSLSQLAFVLWLLGYPDQARQRIQETLTLARDLAHPFSLAYALGWAARTYRLRGEQQASHELEDEWLGLCTEYGFSHQFAMATISQGWGFAEEGQPEAGLMQIRQGLTAYRATGEELGSSSYVILLAEAYGRTGRFAEALTTFSEAQAFVHKTEERFWEAELYRLQGEVTLQQEARAHELEVGSLIPQVSSLKPLAPNGVAREAEAWFLKAIAVARQQQAKSFELRSTVSLARLWHKQGKAREAHQVLSAIHDWFTEGFDTKDLQEAKALLDTLSREGGREETQPNQKRFPTRQSEQDAPEEHSVVVTTMNQELSGERTAGTALSPPLRLAVVNRGKRPPQPSHLQGRKPRIRDKRRT